MQSNFLTKAEKQMLRAGLKRDGIDVQFKKDYAGNVFGVLARDEKVFAYTRSMPTLEDAIFEAHKAIERV